MLLILLIIVLGAAAYLVGSWQPSNTCPRCGKLYPGKNHAMRHLIKDKDTEEGKSACIANIEIIS